MLHSHVIPGALAFFTMADFKLIIPVRNYELSVLAQTLENCMQI